MEPEEQKAQNLTFNAQPQGAVTWCPLQSPSCSRGCTSAPTGHSACALHYSHTTRAKWRLARLRDVHESTPTILAFGEWHHDHSESSDLAALVRFSPFSGKMLPPGLPTVPLALLRSSYNGMLPESEPSTGGCTQTICHSCQLRNAREHCLHERIE